MPKTSRRRKLHLPTITKSRMSVVLSFRLATLAEAPQLAVLINAAFRSERTGQTWLFDSQDKRVDITSASDTAAFINGPNSVMLVGVVAGEESTPMACCFLRKPSSPPEPHMSANAAWLGFLVVQPTRQSRGCGLALLSQAEQFVMQTWGAKRLEMDAVNSRKELLAWYERCGYRVTGAVRPFPYGEKGREILADGLEMIVIGKDLS